MKLSDTLKDSGVSDFYKFKEGDNVMRVMSEFFIYRDHFGKGICTLDIETGEGECLNCEHEKESLDEDGKRKSYPSKKWRAWAHIKPENELKLVTFGKKIVEQISAFQENPEYTWSDYPMPFDITINAKGAGETTVAYTVTPARKNTEVDEKLAQLLTKKKSAEDITKAVDDARSKKEAPPTTGTKYNIAEADEIARSIPF